MDQEMGWEGGYRVDELNIGTDCLPFFPSLPGICQTTPKKLAEEIYVLIKVFTTFRVRFALCHHFPHLALWAHHDDRHGRVTQAVSAIPSASDQFYGSGEGGTTYLDMLPTPLPPNAAPHVCSMPRWPRVPTTSESGRYSAMRRSMLPGTMPAMNSMMMESCTRRQLGGDSDVHGGDAYFSFRIVLHALVLHEPHELACLFAVYVLLLVCSIQDRFNWSHGTRRDLTRTEIVRVRAPEYNQLVSVLR